MLLDRTFQDFIFGVPPWYTLVTPLEAILPQSRKSIIFLLFYMVSRVTLRSLKLILLSSFVTFYQLAVFYSWGSPKNQLYDIFFNFFNDSSNFRYLDDWGYSQ